MLSSIEFVVSHQERAILISDVLQSLKYDLTDYCPIGKSVLFYLLSVISDC